MTITQAKKTEKATHKNVYNVASVRVNAISCQRKLNKIFFKTRDCNRLSIKNLHWG